MSAEHEGHGIVRLIGVSKSFDGVQVLRDVTLQFAEGRTTVVLGPSGCGKTVLLKHIVGLLRPDRGQVWYADTRIDQLREGKLAPIRRKFGFLFQLGALFDSMTVFDNVAFPLVEHTAKTAPQRRERVHRVLRMVGMAGSTDKIPAELSGGQKKRVALARAIVLEPTVMLYDEPTTGLDPIRADIINQLIRKLQRELQMTGIVVTHDLDSAFRVADEMVMLYDGSVVMRGTPDELKASSDPTVQRFLQGEATASELAGISGDDDAGDHVASTDPQELGP